ncbi:unnamed protein product [Orchesella dallaii]|uniref:Uncharacterized protein n=1 Tax=Orchesella dallaii TaxID=48710 RepID=A0ABP1RYD8_9HEXA
MEENSAKEKQLCPYTLHENSAWEVELCDQKDSKVKLTINSVKQKADFNGTTKQYTLQGWLHIEVELVDKSDSIRMIYAQMYDEYFNAIGEFIKDPIEQCPSTQPPNFCESHSIPISSLLRHRSS